MEHFIKDEKWRFIFEHLNLEKCDPDVIREYLLETHSSMLIKTYIESARPMLFVGFSLRESSARLVVEKYISAIRFKEEIDAINNLSKAKSRANWALVFSIFLPILLVFLAEYID
ncbi:MAG: hypothetical protein JKY34_05240 [Kordiimonadaceae bacterium]|nr:hypothetical protein [Kordiimonadaceae bacterium]